MTKLIKVCLLAAAFAFAAGCSTHEPASETHNDTLSNTSHNAYNGKLQKQKCKKHHCGKLGMEKTKKDTTK